MRFSITSSLVLGAYLLTTVSGTYLNAAVRAEELVESTEATQFGSAAQAGATDLRELLVERQGCQRGFGVCSNTGSCCPLGGDCCNNGKCCNAGSWYYTPKICCPNTSNGCAGKGCCPKGSNCCADGRCCSKGSYCYHSPAHGNAIRCCPDGKRCA